MSDYFKFAPVTGDEPIYYVIDQRGVMTIDCDAIHELGRRKGQREILREIARLDEHMDTGRCMFCDAFRYVATGVVTAAQDHAPDCLWLRAQAVKDTP